MDEVIVLQCPEDGSFHILLSFSGLDVLDRTVLSARLVLPAIEVEEPIRIQARPVSRAWSAASVSWTTPWSEPGGDVRPVVRGTSRLHPDRSSSLPISFNVSQAVRGIVNDGEGNYGFLLLPDRPRFKVAMFS